ncbi:MAG: hypothetical protein AAGE52_29990 [Myxococcota bacterium]
MGTWGPGILQNDAAYDGLGDAIREMEGVVPALSGSAEEVPRLLACLGALVQCSRFSFKEGNAFRPLAAAAVKRHRPHLGQVPPEVASFLDAIEGEKEPTYTPVGVPAQLVDALNGTDAGFAKTWARPPKGCFDHPLAKSMLQEFADRRVANIDADFRDEDIVGDLCRESAVMGEFALLLLLEPILIDPARFERWRDLWREGREEPHPDEAEFYTEYDACLEAAFSYGIARFSSAT